MGKKCNLFSVYGFVHSVSFLMAHGLIVDCGSKMGADRTTNICTRRHANGCSRAPASPHFWDINFAPFIDICAFIFFNTFSYLGKLHKKVNLIEMEIAFWCLLCFSCERGWILTFQKSLKNTKWTPKLPKGRLPNLYVCLMLRGSWRVFPAPRSLTT